MSIVDRYLEINRASWDERAAAHAASEFYGVHRFIEDPDFISDVVRFDLPRLGDIRSLRGVHLQCHIGTDTISLARLGARIIGLDLSPASVEHARLLSERAGPHVEFVEAELYQAAAVLGSESFDLVFTGIGALCWLPLVRAWARVVAELLAPGGRLFLREAHPIALGARRAATRRTPSHGLSVLRARRPDHLRRSGHVRRNRPDIYPERHAYVEPRLRRDRDCAIRRRHGTHDAPRARQHPLGGPARKDDANRARRVAADRPPVAPTTHLHAASDQARLTPRSVGPLQTRANARTRRGPATIEFAVRGEFTIDPFGARGESVSEQDEIAKAGARRVMIRA